MPYSLNDLFMKMSWWEILGLLYASYENNENIERPEKGVKEQTSYEGGKKIVKKWIKKDSFSRKQVKELKRK